MRRENTRIFEKETTGSFMNKEFIAINALLTVEQAILYLRENVRDKRNIYYVYIINEHDRLIGALSIRELLSKDSNRLVSEVKVSKIISFKTDIDQEEAVKVFRDTDLVSIPVVNENGKLIGVVHVEDILDVMQQEATEDFHRMAPVSQKLDGGLIESTIGALYRKRIVWLIILVFINVFSGAGIAHFQDVIEANIALVFFLPLLVDSGGNAGSQSSTLVIRAMATGDIHLKDWFRMFTKEVVLSMAMGFTMALAVSAVGLMRGGVTIAIVVSITMVCIVVVGSLVGMSLPFIFRRLKLDPATASAPLITSICDITGVLIYFGIANKLLNL
ncbi:magnesium transporter [Virgibacillus soli]|uniref:magnesium transporter n=1 Tax=Paracerasibacillus soli TaxID=480284 RepID=UPI0035E9AB12